MNRSLKNAFISNMLLRFLFIFNVMINSNQRIAYQLLINRSRMSFSKITVCTSNLTSTDRDLVKSKVIECGGTFTANFTHNVSHLITTTTHSEKYKVAARLGLSIVRLNWLNDCYDSKSILPIDDYIVPPLAGLSICVTGISLTTRTMVENLVKKWGGTYNANLLKTTTHLIANAASGAKYVFAKQWDIKVVSLDWITEMNTSGSFKNENDYSLEKIHEVEVEDIAYFAFVNVYISMTGISASLVQKLRDIIERAGGNVMLDFHSSSVHYYIVDQFPDLVEREKLNKLDRKIPPIHSEWLLMCESKNRIVPYQDYLLSKVKTQILTGQFQESITKSMSTITPRPIMIKKKSLTEFDLFEKANVPVKQVEKYDALPIEPVPPISTSFLSNIVAVNQKKLFSNLKFSSKGYETEQMNVLRSEIELHGGTFTNYDPWSSDYVLTGMQSIALVKGYPKKIVTEYWLEQCTNDDVIYPPTHDISFAPLITQAPLFTSAYNFGISGYEGFRRTHIVCMIELLGGSVTETFSKKNTHLICKPSAAKLMKAKKAKEWGMLVVTWDDIQEWYKRGYVDEPVKLEIEFDVKDVIKTFGVKPQHIKSQPIKKEMRKEPARQSIPITFETGEALKSLDQRSGISATSSFAINRTQSNDIKPTYVSSNNGKRSLSNDFGVLLPKRPNNMNINITEPVLSKEETYDKQVDALVLSTLERKKQEELKRNAYPAVSIPIKVKTRSKIVVQQSTVTYVDPAEQRARKKLLQGLTSYVVDD